MSRVNEIRYVGYAVTDLDAEKGFYIDTWGLEEVAATDDMVWMKTPGHDEHHVLRLRRADEKRIDVISLATETRDDVDALFKQVSKAGCQVIFPPRQLDAPGKGYGFRLFSPDGLSFEISSDVEQGTKRELVRWEGLPVRISHIVLHTPDVQEGMKFFTDVLGFAVSDWLGDFMCFLRCNNAHHRIALLPGPPCLNHVAYDVPDIDDLMKGISRLKQSGIEIAWGPGRHTAGDNTFSYFVTPNGYAVEYTSDLEEVDFEHHVPHVVEPSPTAMDQWGIGVGGPHTMQKPEPDNGLFKAVDI